MAGRCWASGLQACRKLQFLDHAAFNLSWMESNLQFLDHAMFNLSWMESNFIPCISCLWGADYCTLSSAAGRSRSSAVQNHIHQVECWKAVSSSRSYRRLEQLTSSCSGLQNCPSPSAVNASFARGGLKLVSSQGRRKLSSAAEKGLEQKCWACDFKAPAGAFLICPSCSAVQPLDASIDHFQIFDVDRVFRLDLKDVERKYKSLQKKLHPDLLTTKSEREQGYSAEQSSHVIQAYYTLLRPLSRARYMLELEGLKIEEEGTVTDPELLTEVMETREAIEDAEDSTQLRKILDINKGKLEESENMLVNAFDKRDLKTAKDAVSRMSYYQRVAEEITEKL